MRARAPWMPASCSSAMARSRASALRHVGVRADGLDDLVADAIERVEAGERVLEHHADAPAAHLAHLLGGSVVDALAAQPHLAADDAPRRLEQADHGGAGQRLAGARLAHHAQHLAGGDVEGDAVHRGRACRAGSETPTCRLRTERTGSLTACLLGRDELHVHRVLRRHRDVEVALHGVGQHLVMQRRCRSSRRSASSRSSAIVALRLAVSTSLVRLWIFLSISGLE